MKKKMFAILVSLAMTVCMLPTAVFADEAAHRNHCVCGGALEGHVHNTNVTWIGVSSLDEITKSGNYYLKNNVEYNGTYKPADGVVLCLNGKNITCTAANLSTVTVGAGRTFTITDCQTVPGKNHPRIRQERTRHHQRCGHGQPVARFCLRQYARRWRRWCIQR